MTTDNNEPILDQSNDTQVSQDDNSPDDLDYKALYEAEKEKKERTAEKYREKDREKSIITDRFVKLTKTLKDHGLGEVDENFNVVITVPAKSQTQNDDPVQTLDEQISRAKREYEKGDLSSDDYIEKISDLKAQKSSAELERKMLNREAKERETRQQEEQKIQVNDHKTTMLNRLHSEFPGRLGEDGDLFTEMKEIYAADPKIWGDPSNDPTDAYRLAKFADQALKQKKGGTTKVSNQNQPPHSLESGGYSPPVKKNEMSANAKKILGAAGIKDQKIIDDLNTAIRKIEDLDSKSYFSPGQNVMSYSIDNL